MLAIPAFADDAHVEKLVDASFIGDLSTIKRLLKEVVDINALHIDNTVLSQAAKVGRVEVVRFLLDKGAAIDLADSNGHTALTTAVVVSRPTDMEPYRSNRYNVIRLLLDRGANANQRFGRHDWLPKNAPPSGQTSLICAAYHGDLRMCRLLLKHGADVNAQSEYDTPLTTARKKGHLAVVDLLVSYGGKETETAKRMAEIKAACESALAEAGIAVLKFKIFPEDDKVSRSSIVFSYVDQSPAGDLPMLMVVVISILRTGKDLGIAFDNIEAQPAWQGTGRRSFASIPLN
jgi:hypothetical protein